MRKFNLSVHAPRPEDLQLTDGGAKAASPGSIIVVIFIHE